jgi:type IV pilus assembly protein PilA
MDARRRITDDAGFTLVELLVVVLIIGILVAIVLPTLLGQRSKAEDSEAKSMVVAAGKALELWRTEVGTYIGADPVELQSMEPSLTAARGLAVVSTATTFEVGVDSASGTHGGGRFFLERRPTGEVVRTCANPGRGGCGAGGSW